MRPRPGLRQANTHRGRRCEAGAEHSHTPRRSVESQKVGDLCLDLGEESQAALGQLGNARLSVLCECQAPRDSQQSNHGLQGSGKFSRPPSHCQITGACSLPFPCSDSSSGCRPPKPSALQHGSSRCADPTHKIMLLLLHNCSFAPVMNHNVNICVLCWSQATPVKASSFSTRKGAMTHRLRTTTLEANQEGTNLPLLPH